MLRPEGKMADERVRVSPEGARPRPFRTMALGACLGASLLAPTPAAAQVKEYLYVANTLGGDISIVEIPAHRVVGTIPASVVGNDPDDVISSRNGDVLYVSRLDTKDVIAISTATEQVL